LYSSRPTLLTTTSSDVLTLSFFSATDSKNFSTSNEVRFSPYSLLIVSRLIGIGTIWPSTLASTRCW
jgi:hypothetical protein